jgi:hypothetical protein
VKDALAQAFPVRATGSRTRRDAPSGRGPSLILVGACLTLTDLDPSRHTASPSRPITKTILRI